ncbi:BIRC7_8 [Mytilus coruscus]|uniref:BIRC7_8 n=1 Tax=Mytilus coruscus TaxID=42192 RepID=A0A6J8AEQ1_MYTCO|nr:BIRC7_8 [Mytilus coruscus]
MTEETKTNTEHSSQNNYRNNIETAQHLIRLSKKRTDALLASPACKNEETQTCSNLTNLECIFQRENLGSTKSYKSIRKTESRNRTFIDCVNKECVVYSPLVLNVSPQTNLQSFRSWPFEKYDLLVQAGFFYTGDNDVLLCHICNLRTHYHTWPTDEDPMIIHKQLSPLCEYAKQVSNEYRKRKTTDQRKGLPRLPPFAGSARSCSSCGLRITRFEQNQNSLEVHARFSPDCSEIIDAEGKNRVKKEQNRWTKEFVPMFPNQININDRRTSFLRCTTDHVRKLADNLAFTGFFATFNGKSVQATCHCCGLRIDPLKTDTSLWKIHAVLSNHCEYLKVRKGLKYIDNMKNEHLHDNISKTELPKLQIKDGNYTRLCTRKEAESTYCVGCCKEHKQVMFNCGHKMTCQNCSTLYFSCPYCHTALTKRVITFV